MPQVLLLTAWQSRRDECDESVVCDRGDVVQCVRGGAVRECIRRAVLVFYLFSFSIFVSFYRQDIQGSTV